MPALSSSASATESDSPAPGATKQLVAAGWRLGALPSAFGARGLAELVGLVLAVALALLAVVHLDATDRSWLLYYDSDSVLPALVRGSVQAGQPQDWFLSAVLFIPEMGLYFALAALGLGVKGTLALNAVVNLLLLYAALRFLSGIAQRALPPSRRVGGALVAFATVVFLMLLEDSPRGDTFEIASLLATTTYYGLTVLASITATGLAARLVTAPPSRRRRWQEAALTAMSAGATLTNPLYLAWAAMPLVLVLALMAGRRVIGWHRFLRVGAFLLLGGGVGFAARIPFAHLVAKDGPDYAKPGLAAWAALRYPLSLADRTSTIPGALALTLVVALILVSAIVYRRSLASRDATTLMVSGIGWVAPVAVLVGSIALGAYTPRYVQPLFFAPVCTLVFAPRLFPHGIAFVRRLSKREIRRLLASILAVLLVVSAGLTLALGRSAAVVDPDIQCVDAWTTANQRTGAGDFFSTRGPKAYLAEPYRLIQVDYLFRAYPWLADRADYSRSMVSFVLADSLTESEHPRLALPPAARTAPSTTIRCGRYTITDFGTDILPIGPVPAHFMQ
ncbi:hypothetical protein SPF06_02830 [Sinomonas sp. JGH33]|uniref:Glycosyltransferase RgtA/B/C/D-like domain-containing protein n=1 Tax=Sinomonas terricola TaxID=3110330 RepID=A0ABU5T1W6_9MICC|nr:hypothetical protein [Sinomonas sp. JGH33]MEA5453647.1 hypothetical protein [Sinomonas sp. JGH33]